MPSSPGSNKLQEELLRVRNAEKDLQLDNIKLTRKVKELEELLDMDHSADEKFVHAKEKMGDQVGALEHINEDLKKQTQDLKQTNQELRGRIDTLEIEKEGLVVRIKRCTCEGQEQVSTGAEVEELHAEIEKLKQEHTTAHAKIEALKEVGPQKSAMEMITVVSAIEKEKEALQKQLGTETTRLESELASLKAEVETTAANHRRSLSMLVQSCEQEKEQFIKEMSESLSAELIDSATKEKAELQEGKQQQLDFVKMLTKFEKEKADHMDKFEKYARDQAVLEQESAAFETERTQAEASRENFKKQKEEYDASRSSLEDMQLEINSQLASFEEQKAVFDQEQEQLQIKKDEHEQVLTEFVASLAGFEKSKANHVKLEQELAALETEVKASKLHFESERVRHAEEKLGLEEKTIHHVDTVSSFESERKSHHNEKTEWEKLKTDFEVEQQEQAEALALFQKEQSHHAESLTEYMAAMGRFEKEKEEQETLVVEFEREKEEYRTLLKDLERERAEYVDLEKKKAEHLESSAELAKNQAEHQYAQDALVKSQETYEKQKSELEESLTKLDKDQSRMAAAFEEFGEKEAESSEAFERIEREKQTLAEKEKEPAVDRSVHELLQLQFKIQTDRADAELEEQRLRYVGMLESQEREADIYCQRARDAEEKSREYRINMTVHRRERDRALEAIMASTNDAKIRAIEAKHAQLDAVTIDAEANNAVSVAQMPSDAMTDGIQDRHMLLGALGYEIGANIWKTLGNAAMGGDSAIDSISEPECAKVVADTVVNAEAKENTSLRVQVEEQAKQMDILTAKLEDANAHVIETEKRAMSILQEEQKKVTGAKLEYNAQSESEITKLQGHMEFMKKEAGAMQKHSGDSSGVAFGHIELVFKHLLEFDTLALACINSRRTMEEKYNASQTHMDAVCKAANEQTERVTVEFTREKERIIEDFQEQNKRLTENIAVQKEEFTIELGVQLEHKDKLQAEAQELRRDLEESQQAYASASKKLEQTQRKLETLVGANEKLDLEVRELKVVKREIQDKLNEAVTDLQKTNEDFDLKNAECLQVNIDLKKEQSEVARVHKEKDEIEAQIAPLAQTVEEESTRAKGLAKALKETEMDLETTRCEVTELQEQIVEYETKMAETVSNIESLQTEGDELRLNVSSITAANTKLQEEVKIYDEKIAQAEQEKHAVENQLQYSLNEIKDLQQTHKETVEACEQVTSKLTETQTKYDDLRMSMKAKEADITEKMKAKVNRAESLATASEIAKRTLQHELVASVKKVASGEALREHLVSGEAEEVFLNTQKQLEQQVSDLEKSVRVAGEEIEKLKFELTGEVPIADSDPEAAGLCETCGQPNIDVKALLSEKQNLLDNLEAVEKAAEEHKTNCQAAQDATASLAASQRDLKAQIKELSSNLQKSKLELETMSQMKVELNTLVQQLKTSLTESENKVQKEKQKVELSDTKLSRQVEANMAQDDTVSTLKNSLKLVEKELSQKVKEYELLKDDMSEQTGDVALKVAALAVVTAKATQLGMKLISAENERDAANFQRDQAVSSKKSEVERLTAKGKLLEEECKGLKKDLPRLQSQIESMTVKNDNLKEETQEFSTKWELAQKDATGAKVALDQTMSENERHVTKISSLEGTVEQFSATGQVTADLHKKLRDATLLLDQQHGEIDKLKVECAKAELTLKDFTREYNYYKTVAEETSSQRRAREVSSATKLQAVHRGRKGRSRAEFVKRHSYAELSQQDLAKETLLTDQVAMEMAEEDAMLQRAQKRAEDAVAERKVELKNRMWWNWVLDRMILANGGEKANAITDLLMDRIIMVKCMSFSQKYLDM